MLKGILFDFDGTLVDTNGLILKSMRATFSKLLNDPDVSDDVLLDCIGPPLVATARRFLPEDEQLFVDTYREFCFEYHDELVEIYPGVVELLVRLRESGFKLVVVTSKKRDMLLKGLNATGIADFFDELVCEEDVDNHKPEPDAVLVAMERAGLAPDECLMVGDNYHDILSARAAGVRSVAVGWSIKGIDYLKGFEPDYVIDEASDLLMILGE